MLRTKPFKVSPRCLRLLSSLEDTPLTLVRAAGISVVMSSLGDSEVDMVPLLTVLPVTAMAIVCVWATYCSTARKPDPVHESAPEPAQAPELSL